MAKTESKPLHEMKPLERFLHVAARKISKLAKVPKATIVIDAHLYGGGLLAAFGIGELILPSAGAIVFGCWLAYLGLRATR